MRISNLPKRKLNFMIDVVICLKEIQIQVSGDLNIAEITYLNNHIDKS